MILRSSPGPVYTLHTSIREGETNKTTIYLSVFVNDVVQSTELAMAMAKQSRRQAVSKHEGVSNPFNGT